MSNIVAPNLKNLILEGNATNHLNLGELDRMFRKSYYFYGAYSRQLSLTKYEVLCSLCSANVLFLNEATIKVK